MSLESLLAKFPKISKHARTKSLKKCRKFILRVSKFSRREGCYVVSTANIKCLDCGYETFGHRLGCPECSAVGGLDGKRGVVYGALLNTGKINKQRLKPLIEHHEFIPYTDLFKRIKAGDRFYDTNSRTELTIKNFCSKESNTHGK